MTWLTRLLGIIAAVFIAESPATEIAVTKTQANHVLVHDGRTVVPLTTVQSGKFGRLPLENSAPAATATANDMADGYQSSVGMNGTTVYKYLNGRLIGKGKVVGYREGDYDNGIEAEVTIVSPEDETEVAARIFTSQPLPIAVRNPARKASLVEIAAARKLARAALQRHRVPSAVWPRAVKYMTVQPIHVRSGEPEILLIYGDLTIAGYKGNDKALGFLLIGERRMGGYQLTLNKVHWPGLVCAETRWEFLDHADLDSNGTDELVLMVWGWESWDEMILRRENGRWKRPGIDENEWPRC